MDARDFDKFFSDFGLESMKDLFVENGFETVLALQEVSDEDLKEIGVRAMGKRRQFLGAVKKIAVKNTSTKGDVNVSLPATPSGEPEMLATEFEKDEELPKLDTRHGDKEPVSKRKLDLDGNDSDGSTPSKHAKKQETQSGLHKWFKSPFNPEKILKSKNIHLYSDTEIKRAYGLRKRKMEFVNAKLLSLIEDADVRGKNKATIIGMAEVAWDHYNATEAKIDIIEVSALIKSLEARGKTFNEKQTKTIKAGVERVNRAQFDIKSQLRLIKEYKESKEKATEIEKAEDELVCLHHELQKATDALRKSCCVKISTLQQMLKTDSKEAEEKEQVEIQEEEYLSDDSIVNDIKCDDENETNA